MFATCRCEPHPRVLDDVPLANLQRALCRGDDGEPLGRDFDTDILLNAYRLRSDFRNKYCFPFPQKAIIDALVEHSPILSVGCGTAYMEHIAILEGADILCTDTGTQEGNCMKMDNPHGFLSRVGKEIEIMDGAEAVRKYPGITVFMSWPDFRHDLAGRVAGAMQSGTKLLYIGESRHGCTADNTFFDQVEAWGDYEYLANTNFEGVHDGLYLYTKP